VTYLDDPYSTTVVRVQQFTGTASHEYTANVAPMDATAAATAYSTHADVAPPSLSDVAACSAAMTAAQQRLKTTHGPLVEVSHDGGTNASLTYDPADCHRWLPHEPHKMTTETQEWRPTPTKS
jgi:hypothetical protein